MKSQNIIEDDEAEHPSYIPIPHLRDQLIAPRHRQKKQIVFDNALDFILKNESRICVETKTIKGEDYEVLQWVQVCLSLYNLFVK